MSAAAVEDPRLWVNRADWVHGEFPARPDPGDDVGVRFYLGAPHAHWLGQARVPLFVSFNTLRRGHAIRRSKAAWAIDSGGFTELSRHGRWTTSAAEYADAICRYHLRDHGHLVFCAPQDWMCEPEMISGGRLPSGETAPGTGLSVLEHQHRTVASVLELRDQLAVDDLAHLCIPVLQGWTADEYEHCARLYAAAGIDLAAEPLVGVGSMCRRQATSEILAIVRDLHAGGLRLHGFGVSRRGLTQLAPYLASADSMAWSLAARMADGPISRDCTHRRCTTCARAAMRWRQNLLDELRSARRATVVPLRSGSEFDVWADQWRAAA